MMTREGKETKGDNNESEKEKLRIGWIKCMYYGTVVVK